VATLHFSRPIKTLEDNIAKVDAQYEIMIDLMAKGENDGFTAEPCSQQRM